MYHILPGGLVQPVHMVDVSTFDVCGIPDQLLESFFFQVSYYYILPFLHQTNIEISSDQRWFACIHNSHQCITSLNCALVAGSIYIDTFNLTNLEFYNLEVFICCLSYLQTFCIQLIVRRYSFAPSMVLEGSTEAINSYIFSI